VFVDLSIQHKVHMRLILLLSVACLGFPHLSTLFHKRKDILFKQPLNIKW
jgi:hypothetical protein